MSTNLFARFKKLFEGPPLFIGTVTVVETGFCLVSLPGGGVLRVRGESAIGSKVFIRDGLIEGAAPDLPTSIIDI